MDLFPIRMAGRIADENKNSAVRATIRTEALKRAGDRVQSVDAMVMNATTVKVSVNLVNTDGGANNFPITFKVSY